MNYIKTAQQIFQSLGGNDNILSVSHCMTRLRFVLKDDANIDDNQIKNISGVIGVNRKNEQYQIIIGHNVKKCYEALIEMRGGETNNTQLQQKKLNLFEYLISVIAGSIVLLGKKLKPVFVVCATWQIGRAAR